MNIFFRGLALSAIIVAIGAGKASASSYTIDDSTDAISGGIGNFYLVVGNDDKSSPGLVQEVLGGPQGTLQGSDPETQTKVWSIASLYDLLIAANFQSAQKLVFGLGINQVGPVDANPLTVTDLTMIFDLPGGGTETFSLGTDINNATNSLTVYNYASGGQNIAEVRLGIDFGAGFDFLTQYANVDRNALKFSISSTITGGNDGYEIYFFSSAFTADENPGSGGVGSAVPEPATLTLFGTGLAFVATQIRRRRKGPK